MALGNIVYVEIIKHDTHKTDDLAVYWKPVNYMVLIDHDDSLIKEAIDEYLSETVLLFNHIYNLVFVQIIEHDGAGAVTAEYYKLVYLQAAPL